MTGIHRLNQATAKYTEQKQDTKKTYSGLLGFIIKGIQLVSVPNRTGYVYVRLRDNPSEFLQAYNETVSLTYDLPIIVSRDTTKNRYVVEGRDIGRYDNWGTSSSYLPPHGDTHSFGDEFIGKDITWVYDRQLMPLLVTPSGSAGAGNVIVRPDAYYWNGLWRYAGNTGTADILGYKPADGNAKMVLVYLDGDGNPQLEVGSTFDPTITGTAGVIPYLPLLTESLGIPLAGIRLLSGTASILWDNIYDFRPLVVGASRYIVQDDGVSLPKQNYLNFIGDLVWVWDDPDNGSTVIAISGSSTSPFKEFVNPSSGSVYRTNSYGVPLNQTLYPLGPHAVDLQAKRSGANQRAGGYGSTILGGSDNEIGGSGTYSIVGGYRNYSSARGSIVLGGQDNLSLGRGVGYTADAIYSHLMLGGYDNNITAGYMNTIINSIQSRISGTHQSIILNGYLSSARGQNFVYGRNASANHARAVIFNTYQNDAVSTLAEGEFLIAAESNIRLLADRTSTRGDFVASGTSRANIGRYNTVLAGSYDAGNYANVESDGTIVLYGTAKGWDSLLVPASVMKLGGTYDPEFGAFRNTGGSSRSVKDYLFDAIQEEELFFNTNISPRWKEGNTIYPLIHWSALVTDAVNVSVAWGLDYTMASESGVFPITTRIVGNAIHNYSVGVDILAYKHYITALPTISMVGKTILTELSCRIFRDGAGAYGYTDDYPNDAVLLSIDFHYEVDTPQGSNDEYTK